mgnify:CR=1 FL=1|tara:strand:- start:1334 stop:2059 length:726 start_codon:yes stop_codon:yes gene_type:complete
MSILPVVQQDLEEKLDVEEEIIENETENESEEEEEPIIEVKERKKAVRNEIFDIKEEPEPEPEHEPEPEPQVVPETVEPVKPKKRRPAKFYEEGHTEGDFRVMIDKNGSKRWVNDKHLQRSRERLSKMHKEGLIKHTPKKKKPPPVEKQLQDVLKKQEEQTNNLSEQFLKKYQEDLMKVVQQASLQAVETYDTKRKERKKEKKAKQQADLVNSQLQNKLAGIQQQRKPKYGEAGFFNDCWN